MVSRTGGCLCGGRSMGLKVGDQYLSTQGTNLRLTVKAVTRRDVTVTAERKLVDRKTGEVKIENRERTVPKELWPNVIAAYRKA